VVAANGDEMGGFQAIQFMPPGHEAQTRSHAGSSEQPINGVYRGASDHRKDGEAVGW
jgi:gamma-glutamyltranspeptidase / glutathione hydrolase